MKSQNHPSLNEITASLAKKSPHLRRGLLALNACGLIVALAACGAATSEAELLASARAMLTKGDLGGAQVQLKSAIQQNGNSFDARYLLGTTFLSNGEFAPAEVELTKARQLKPADAGAMGAMAQTMLGLHKYGKLVEEFGATEPADKTVAAQIAASVGLALVQLGKVSEGRAKIQHAIELAPESGPARIAMAKVSLMAGDSDTALKLLDQVLATSPREVDAFILKGELLSYFRKDFDGARAVLQKGLSIQPSSLLLHTAQLASEIRRGTGVHVAADMEAMKKALPNHPQTFYLGAVVAYTAKDFKTAKERIEPLEKAMPDDNRVLQLGGAINYQLDDFRQAESKLKRAMLAKDGQAFGRQVLAQTYIRTGEPQKAFQTLAPLLQAENVDFESLTLAAECLVQAGEYAKAEEYFARALKLKPNSGTVQIALALTDLAKGKSESAFSQLERIAVVDKGTAADLAIISARMRLGASPELFGAIDRLESKEPNKPLAPDLRARAMLLKPDRPGARRSFEQALKIDPTYFPAAASLAALDREDGNFKEAHARLAPILAANPKHLQARMADIGLTVAGAGSPAEVERLLKAAINDLPGDVEPRAALVDLYLSQNRSDQAISVAQEASAAFSSSAAALDGLGRAYAAHGDYGQAVSAFNRMASLDSTSPTPYRRLAEASVRQGNYVDSLKYMRRAVSIAPGDQRLAEETFAMAMQGKQYDDAISMARAYQRQKPNEAIGLMLEGDVNAVRKRWPEAIDLYRQSLRVQPQASKVAIKLYQATRAGSGEKDAQAVLDAWLKSHPTDTGMRIYLADTALRTNELSLAESRYRDVLAIDSKHVSALNNLAWLMVRQGKQGASKFAKQASELQPGSPPIEDTLAQALANDGQVPQALELQRKLVSRAPAVPAFRITLAKILLKAGNKAEARTELEALSKLGAKLPEHKEIQQLLAAAGA